MPINFEIILDWQQRGVNARILGRDAADNPVLPYLNNPEFKHEHDNWLQKAEAWMFGWSIEDAVRS